MTYDVAVVGGGLTGSFTAWAAAALGYSVLLAEARAEGHGEGSSQGTSRIFRTAYPDPLYAGLVARALPLWRRLETESRTSLLTTTGCVEYGRDRDLGALYEAVRGNGVPAELLPAAAAAERFPGLLFPTEVLHHSGAGHLDPSAAIAAALSVAAKNGADVVFETPVESVEQKVDAVVLSTPRGIFRARQVVVAAGPWLPELLPGILPDEPAPALTVTEQNVLHFARVDPAHRWPVLVCKHGNQLFGLPSGADGGPVPAVKIGWHEPGPVTAPDRRNGVPDAAARRAVTDFVGEWMPGLVPTPSVEGTCLYTSTRNEDFLIDRRGRVTVASPCSGQGAKYAPVLGRIIVDVAHGRTEPNPRFTLATHASR